MSDNAELLRRLSMGEEDAADKLVENNMGLVYSIASRFANRRCEHEDLMQIGAIGLIKAVKKFDLSYGVQFSTYAVPMIIGEIKRFLRDDGAIKVSRSVKETAIKVRRAGEKLQIGFGRTPTMSELAAETGISEEDISEALAASAEPESLQASIGDGDRTIMDRLVSDDTEEQIVDKVFLKEALSHLSDRERDIIIMRYFKGKTQSETAAEVGVSQVQISRIEKKALLKLREKAMG